MLNCRNFRKFSAAFGGRQGQTPASSLGRSDLFSTAHLQGSSSGTDDTQHLTSIRIREVAPQQGPGSQARPRVGPWALSVLLGGGWTPREGDEWDTASSPAMAAFVPASRAAVGVPTSSGARGTDRCSGEGITDADTIVANNTL